MADKSGYWDVNRCAWVDAEPTHGMSPPPTPGGTVAAADPVPVPEQRAVAEAVATAEAPD